MEEEESTMAEENEREKQNIDPVTGAAPPDTAKDSDKLPDAGGRPDSDPQGLVGDIHDTSTIHDRTTVSDRTNVDRIDRTAQSNLGGRNPGQPQGTIGDRDATWDRGDADIVDPMSSRTPDKVNQQSEDMG